MKPLEDNPVGPDIPDRPLASTLVCLWWFVAVPIGSMLASLEIARVLSTSGASEALRMQYIGAALYTVILAAGVMCMLGVWQMKKEGVIAFVVLFVIGQLVPITQGGWSLGGFVAWLIGLIVGMLSYPQMR